MKESKKGIWRTIIIIGIIVLIAIWVVGIKIFISAGKEFAEEFIISENEFREYFQ